MKISFKQNKVNFFKVKIVILESALG